MFALVGVLAAVVIHVEEVRGVKDDELRTITAELERAIGVASGTVAAVLPKNAVDCPKDVSCVPRIRERLGVKDVVVVRVLGIPTIVRVLAERAGGNGVEARSAKADLSRAAPGEWSARIKQIAAAMYPRRSEAQPAAAKDPDRLARVSKPAPALIGQPIAPIEREFEPWPWVLIGGGAAAGIAGAVLGAVNTSARNEGQSSMDPARVAVLDDRAFATGLGANIMFGVAAAGIVSGVAWLVSE